MVLKFEPETYYDEFSVRVMGLDEDTLREAREKKQLRYREVAGSIVYKGAWLVAWLDRSEAEASGAGSGGKRGVVAQ